ncbi:uncharacterized protein A1O9_03213 [Exophiala aquamarina CBS 119918]|uniref:AB hydrolase-1 domain-containing protein n=1 Tax=Exophiala aquamarina CBS 119918 TaxID=1182545 RepID=A0A072Q163_9EURO|nr:uncharacterized protein A1O9_03213 [Exophiala aquamarina CBS 119918]KEF61645.1 hypothetical protein A1O9_03213 [Exophiala aquamarina CBS 119918]
MRRQLVSASCWHASSRRYFSSTRSRDDVIDLAFHRHDPPAESGSKIKGPPIVLMHGLFGSQRNNRTMMYNIDLRNHGDSAHSPAHDYTSMAEDVEAFIAAQQLPKPTLIGHSMGAKVAMTLALRSPNKYSALIPVDNAPVDAALKSDFGKYVNAMREIDEQGPQHIQKQSDADKILAKYEPDVSIRQFLLTNLVKMAPKRAPAHKAGDHRHAHKTELRLRIPLQTLAKSLPAMADFPFKDPDVARFEGPTLVVRGTKSHYVADETLPLIGNFFPRFELLDCDCGHWVMAENFEQFRAGVVEWIERVVDES